MTIEDKIVLKSTLVGDLYFRTSMYSDVGLQRTENQDSYGFAVSRNSQLNIIADGMGGARGGGTASAIAIKNILAGAFNELAVVTKESILDAINKTNEIIYEYSKQDPLLQGMGTTLVSLVISQERVFSVHVGDSRVYRLTNGEIQVVTKDHTLVQELVDTGAIKEKEAASHPISHMLTRSLGPAFTTKPELTLIENVAVGDKFLLCSDGLYNHIESHIIQRTLSKLQGKEAVRQLAEFVFNDGATDNLTIELIEVFADKAALANFEVLSEGEIKRYIFSEIELDKQAYIVDESSVEDRKEIKGTALDSLYKKIEKDLEERRSSLTPESEVPRQIKHTTYNTEKLISFIGVLFLAFLSTFLYFREPKIITKVNSKIVHEIANMQNENLEKNLLEKELLQVDRSVDAIREFKASLIGHVERENKLLEKKLQVSELQRNDSGINSIIEEEVRFAINQTVAPSPTVILGGLSFNENERQIINWEDEKKVIARINNPVKAVKDSPAQAVEKNQLRTAEEDLNLVHKKEQVRDKIYDIDFKLELIMLDTEEQVKKRHSNMEQVANNINKAILVLRDDLEIYQKNQKVWQELMNDLQKQSAFKVADNAAQVSAIIYQKRADYTDLMESYFVTVDKWQASPQDSSLSEELARLTNEAKDKKLRLELAVKEIVSKENLVVIENIARTKFEINRLLHRGELINKRIGYLSSYLILSMSRKRELQKDLLKDRKKLYQEFLGYQDQLNDEEERAFRMRAQF